jgi:hypothetical protein
MMGASQTEVSLIIRRKLKSQSGYDASDLIT